MNNPKVGLFWFDAKADKLFGGITEDAAKLPFNGSGFKTLDVGHMGQWKATGCLENYLEIPRGRIYEVKGKGFQIMVGSWIEEYPQAKELIIKEFNLGNENYEFVINEKWEVVK